MNPLHDYIKLEVWHTIVESYDDAVDIIKSNSVLNQVLCVRYCKDGDITNNTVSENIGMLFGIGVLDDQEKPFIISSELEGLVGGNIKYLIKGKTYELRDAIEYLLEHLFDTYEPIIIRTIFQKSEAVQMANIILGLDPLDDDGTLLDKLNQILSIKEDLRTLVDGEKDFSQYYDILKDKISE